MFSPTDVVVVVRQARNLLIKAKGGVNDAYATIELLKEKYATASEKSLIPKWFTECTFSLPQGGVFNSKVVVIICVYHKRHGKLGLEPDEFLGQAQVPLSALNSSDDKERSRWYRLSGKKKDSKKERGEVEVAFKFICKSRDAILPDKRTSPKHHKSIKSSLKNKLRRRSDDEDSGLGASEGDRYQGATRGSSCENLSVPSIVTSQSKPFERSFRTSSTNSSPGALHSARGSARLLQTNSNLPSNKAVSVEVLNSPEKKGDGSSLFRSNSGGGGGGGKIVKRFIKQHTRNRSMPDSSLVPMMGQLRKDNTTKSAICINGSHLYVPGSRDSGNNSMAASPETKIRSSSMEDMSDKKTVSSSKLSPQSKKASSSSRRHSMVDLENIKQQSSSISTLYKPKNYYRLDVKDLRKVSTIHEDVNTASYQAMSHEHLVRLVTSQQRLLNKKDEHIRELEDYIDSLLVKVITFTPQILDESLNVYK